jgi:hypothetical protein
VLGSSNSGAGGRADAYAGVGGRVSLCEPGACPSRGRRGADGGDGGRATARGGDGAVPGRIFGSAFAGRPIVSVEDRPSAGGAANAVGGDAEDGGAGETAESPGAGGKGGRGGASTSFGGAGGACRVGVDVAGGQNVGGVGGHADAGGGSSRGPGNGGPGGACCDSVGGTGAPGGKAGVAEPQKPTGGKGGSGGKAGRAGPVGGTLLDAPGTAADGAAGANCAGLAYILTVFPNPPVHGEFASLTLQIVNTSGAAANGLDVELRFNGTRIHRQTVDVPSGTEASPTNRYVSGETTPSKAGPANFEVKVNGKSVGKITFSVN